MEINPSNTAARACYEDVIWAGRDNDVGQTTSKSYSCTFCKRGFSNAQALGGHMNIHRKDRARLRESSSDDQTQVPSPEEATTKKDESSLLDHDPEKNSSGSNKRPWSFSELEDDCSPRKKEGSNVGETTQIMTLFVETSSGDHHEGRGSREKDVVKVEASTQGEDHLDLELRLGMDCQGASRKDAG